MKSFATKATALMELLESRKAWDLPDHKRPDYDPLAMERAAKLAARADPSDPFAYSRAILHLRGGLSLAEEVRADADKIIRTGPRT